MNSASIMALVSLESIITPKKAWERVKEKHGESWSTLEEL